MPSVPGFLPSVNGLRFINAWPHEPNIEVDVAPFGTIPIGDASNGLCGGMVFAVRDVFDAGLPPLEDPRPEHGTALFDYIVRRLFDSFDLPNGVLKYFEWMNTPDGDTSLWVAVRRGVAWKTVREEWPRVRADIDAGHPCPLGLVTVESGDPNDLGKNHQVLAYRYDLIRDVLTLHVYDPNTERSNGDGAFLRMHVEDPTKATPIQHTIEIDEPVRGFFRVDYARRDPSSLYPPAPVP